MEDTIEHTHTPVGPLEFFSYKMIISGVFVCPDEISLSICTSINVLKCITIRSLHIFIFWSSIYQRSLAVKMNHTKNSFTEDTKVTFIIRRFKIKKIWIKIGLTVRSFIFFLSFFLWWWSLTLEVIEEQRHLYIRCVRFISNETYVYMNNGPPTFWIVFYSFSFFLLVNLKF